jgi:hypothetical protein
MPRRLVTELKEGDDVHKAVGDLYHYKRIYPHKPPHDYQPQERKPHPEPPAPGWGEYRARYGPARGSDVSPAPSEQACQFPSEKVADHVDVGRQWTRGYGESPYPHFDSGPSGHRYRK